VLTQHPNDDDDDDDGNDDDTNTTVFFQETFIFPTDAHYYKNHRMLT